MHFFLKKSFKGVNFKERQTPHLKPGSPQNISSLVFLLSAITPLHKHWTSAPYSPQPFPQQNFVKNPQSFIPNPPQLLGVVTVSHGTTCWEHGTRTSKWGCQINALNKHFFSAFGQIPLLPTCTLLNSVQGSVMRKKTTRRCITHYAKCDAMRPYR